MNRAVFLDRDDTLIECRGLRPDAGVRQGDLRDPARVSLLPGAAEGLHALSRAGFTLVVVSNQGIVARGGAGLEDVERVNQRLRAMAREQAGVEIDAFYYCPFHPGPFDAPGRFRREHPWRKPGGGMIRAAARELEVDLAPSWMVGDADRDIEAGHDAGIDPAHCLRIAAEGGGDARDLAEAARIILGPEEAASIIAHGGEVTSVILRPRTPGVLEDARVAGTVIAVARSVADRAGVATLSVHIAPEGLVMTAAGGRLVVLGLAAEVRRLTNRWRLAHAGQTLWEGVG